MMNNSMTGHQFAEAHSTAALLRTIWRLPDRIPFSIIQLASRIAVAKVFWASSHAKLASWPVTLQLFAMEYRVPFLPTETAALLATATEYCGAVLILLGLLTRFAALALLGVIMIIQIFVYPGNWAEHLLWASPLLLLLARGAGTFSLDHLLSKFLPGRQG